MKKLLLLLFFAAFNMTLFANDFIFPPELKWWIDEFQKVDGNVSLENFKLTEESTLLESDAPISYKNRLYPVFKKWNYYGNQFAYYPIRISLTKEKNGKYSIDGGDADSEFGIFNRDETLCFVDFFGSSITVDSYCWVRDNRITAVGYSLGSTSDEGYLFITDYLLKDGKCTAKRYECKIKGSGLSKLRHRWTEQRRDYFEQEAQ